MSKKLEQEARIGLLRYYSSKCTAHGTNLLAIAVTFFAYVEVISLFSGLGRIIIHSIFIPAFVVLVIHQIVRLLVWGKLTQTILGVDPEEVKKKWREEIPNNENLLRRLDRACGIEFRNQHRFLSSINSKIEFAWGNRLQHLEYGHT